MLAGGTDVYEAKGTYASDRAAESRTRNGAGHLVVRWGWAIATVYLGSGGWWFRVTDVRKKFRTAPPKYVGPFSTEAEANSAALKDLLGY